MATVSDNTTKIVDTIRRVDHPDGARIEVPAVVSRLAIKETAVVTSPGPALSRLSATQQARLDEWLGTYWVLVDHSWPRQSTAVLELGTHRGRMIVKASTGALQAHHITREITTLREAVADLGDGFPALLHADADAGLLVTRYLPGRLAEGSPWERDPGVYRAAGRLLARLHGARGAEESADYQVGAIARIARWIDAARGLLDRETWDEASVRARSLEPRLVPMVPTHGDFQPRNWLVDPDDTDHDGVPRPALIDFGRGAARPWYSDLVRLHHQVFVHRPDLQRALLAGAGRPADWSFTEEELAGWRMENLLQSLGAVVWAVGVGDLAFAQQGREMLTRTLAAW